jgi:copper chaperone
MLGRFQQGGGRSESAGLQFAIIRTGLDSFGNEAVVFSQTCRQKVVIMETITLSVTGMQCGGCASTIKEKLEGSAGVAKAEADHREGVVKIEFDPEKTNLEALKTIIMDAGYTPN